MGDEALRTGIVGGGITGLALTHFLAVRGLDSVLLERASEPGGIIRSRRSSGRVTEAGPQRTRLVGPVERLVEATGLAERVIRAPPGLPLYILKGGRLKAVPTRVGRFLRSDLLSVAGRLRVLLEPLTPRLAAEESVAGFLRRKVGDEAYRTLFGPLVAATFASDPERMPAVRSLPMLLGPLGVRRSLVAGLARAARAESAPACSFVDGLQELPRALARLHAARVRLDTSVEGITPAAGGYDLDIVSRSERDRVHVDRLVLTVPASEAARLLGSFHAAATRLAELRYNAVSVVDLETRAPLRGYGFQAALDESLRTRGVTWNASLLGREGVCTAYLGGGLDPEVEAWPDERVARTAADEFEEVHGAPARAVGVTRTWMPAFDDSWPALDRLSLPPGIRIAANWWGRPGIAGRIAEAERLADELAAERTLHL